MTRLPSQPSVAFRLVSFDEESDNNNVVRDADLTLARFFERYYLLDLQDAQRTEGTIVSYRESLSHWRWITGDPQLWKIDRATVSQFLAGLRMLPGVKSDLMADHTQRKHARQVKAVLRRCGPATMGNELGAGLIDCPPPFKLPTVADEPPDADLSIEQLQALLDAVAYRKSPKKALTGIEPAEWWRSLIDLAYYTGLRRETLLDLRYSWLEQDWLNVPAKSIKGRKKGLRVPLCEPAREAIERIRTDREKIFPFPSWPSVSAAGNFNNQARQLFIDAGVYVNGKGVMHRLRKTHLTQLADIDLMAAQMSAGHSDIKTTQKHYINHKRVLAAARQLPRIERPLDKSGSNQMTLF